MVGIYLINTLLAVTNQERLLVAALVPTVVLTLIITRVGFVMGLVAIFGRRMPTFRGQPTTRLMRGPSLSVGLVPVAQSQPLRRFQFR